ncbi:MAG: type II toxin-antitoxin system HicB family antitoxin [Alphaproteobacteria bacterium]|nr:type II toxin-antitoxin system HicB family antitoxin [Alphaproteobacteria bacterium]
MTTDHKFPARLDRDESGRIVVSFRDVPEALTDGADRAEALSEAEDALLVALAGYVDDARNPKPLPRPSRKRQGEVVIALPLLASAKLALHDAMREAGINGTDLARKMDLPVTAVRRLLNLHHNSKIEQVALALATLGKRAEIRVSDAVL